MRYKELTKELSKYIAASLGAVPGNENAGLKSKDLIVDKFEVENEDGSKEIIDIYYGVMTSADDRMLAALVMPKEEEVALIIGFDGNPIIQFKYNWKNEYDVGELLFLTGNGEKQKWIEMDLRGKLRFALGIETMIQAGTLWERDKLPPLVREYLVKMIEVEG